MPKERLYHTEQREIASQALEKWEPTNSGEFLGGLVIIIMGVLVALWMYFNHKNKNPNLQSDREFNDKYANLDKRISLNEQKTNNLETNLNQQFTGIHVRLGKIEETMLLLVASRDNKS